MSNPDRRSPPNYRDVLKDNASLADFLSAMQDFDRAFCDSMATGADFTIKLEVHGCKGELLHARMSADSFRRPSGSEKRVEAKNPRNSV
jgi:hypothetical protein